MDRNGQVTINGWTYGDEATQDTLLRHRGVGKTILLGRNPDDFGQPALAYGDDARLIVEGIRPVKPGLYGSADGIRQAATNRKKMRDPLAAHQAANRTFADEEIERLFAQIPTPGAPPKAPARKVVGGRFGGPLATSATPAPAEPISEMTAVPEEYLRNFDASLAKRLRKGRGA